VFFQRTPKKAGTIPYYLSPVGWLRCWVRYRHPTRWRLLPFSRQRSRSTSCSTWWWSWWSAVWLRWGRGSFHWSWRWSGITRASTRWSGLAVRLRTRSRCSGLNQQGTGAICFATKSHEIVTTTAELNRMSSDIHQQPQSLMTTSHHSNAWKLRNHWNEIITLKTKLMSEADQLFVMALTFVPSPSL